MNNLFFILTQQTTAGTNDQSSKHGTVHLNVIFLFCSFNGKQNYDYIYFKNIFCLFFRLGITNH